MPYTNPWIDSIPLGSQNANTADDEFRKIKLDIHERMDDIVVDWTADPIVLAAGAFSKAKTIDYDDSAGAGLKGTNYTDLEALLSIQYNAVTDALGQVVVNFNEVDPSGDTWDVGANTITLRGWYGFRSAAPTIPIFVSSVGFNVPANTYTIIFRDTTGNLVTNAAIIGVFTFMALTSP